MPVVEHLVAAVDHHDVVAQLLGVHHDVRREQDRGPAAVLLVDQFPQQPLVHRVEAAEGLVEDEQVGPVDDGGHELHLLLHALRQFLAALVLDAAQVHLLEPRADARPQVGPVGVLEAGHVGEELADPHALVEAALLGEVADPVLRLHRRPVAQHRELAAIRHQDGEDHPDDRGLAGAVRADHPVEGALRARRDRRSRTATVSPKVLVSPRRTIASGIGRYRLCFRNRKNSPSVDRMSVVSAPMVFRYVSMVFRNW